MPPRSEPPSAKSPGGEIKTVKLSVNVSATVGERLRRIAFVERLSESSIVTIALDHLFNGKNDESLAQFLRERGASLRRHS
jgi:hypothetical protein